MPLDPARIAELEGLMEQDAKSPTGVCSKCGYVGECDQRMMHPDKADGCRYAAARVMPRELVLAFRESAPDLIRAAKEGVRMREALEKIRVLDDYEHIPEARNIAANALAALADTAINPKPEENAQ